MSISRKVMPSCFCVGVGAHEDEHPVRPCRRTTSRPSGRSGRSRRRRARRASAGRPGRSRRPARSSPGTSGSRRARSRGRCSRFCSSLPSCRSSGPIIASPKPMSGGRSFSFAISSARTFASSFESPPPPYSRGHVGAVQPRSAISASQRRVVVGVAPLLAAPADVVGRRGRRAHRRRRVLVEPATRVLAKSVRGPPCAATLVEPVRPCKVAGCAACR